MQNVTNPTKKSEIVRAWHLVDANGVILGRMATNIAQFLMGKSKPYFVRHLDCGDYVVVINAKQVKVSGKKEELKIYTRYSGYPGGLKSETLKSLRARKPTEIIRHAVSGMLPHNRLHDRMLERLHIYEADTHPYEDKFRIRDTKQEQK